MIDVSKIEYGEVHNVDNLTGLKSLPDNCIDLCLTSPPYDYTGTVREYKGVKWDRKMFELVAQELYRVIKPNGVVVWVVADTTRNFKESLDSFKQAIYFVDNCGFSMNDTMIYQKAGIIPLPPAARRYESCFEYMFVLTKGGRPKTFNPQEEKRLSKQIAKKSAFRQADGTMKKRNLNTKAKINYRKKTNVWKFKCAYMQGTKDKFAYEHPAMFPERLAYNHILSWTNKGDIVLDIFGGSGTTGKIAILNKRKYIGFELSPEYTKIHQKRIDLSIKAMKGGR